MLLHLESGRCSAGWKIRHINDLAHTSSGAEKYIIQSQFGWFMAGAPPIAAVISDYESTSQRWNCPICPTTFSKPIELTKHLSGRTCSQGYPKVLSCPRCPQTFIRLSAMLQHIEGRRCDASYKKGVIADLLKHLKQTLDMFSPELFVGRDVYELKLDGSNDKLMVTITDADQSSAFDYLPF